MIVTRLGDGDPNRAQTLGGGPLGADVFDFGMKSSLALGLRAERRNNVLLAVGARPTDPVIMGPSLGDISPGGAGGGDSGGGNDPDAPDTGSGNNGTDGD